MTPNDTERARMPGARNSDTAFNSHTTQVRGDQYPGSSAPTSHNSRADEGHLGRNDDDPGNGSDNARRASASTADSARSTSATSSTGSDVDSLLDFYLSEPTGTPPLSSVAPPEASEAALPSPYAQGPQLERGTAPRHRPGAPYTAPRSERPSGPRSSGHRSGTGTATAHGRSTEPSPGSPTGSRGSATLLGTSTWSQEASV